MGIIDLENYAKEKGIPIMQKEGIRFLQEYIKKNNIQNILEIGAAIGYSAIQMALAVQNVRVTTIERDYPRYLEAVKNIHNFNLDKNIRIINADALDIDIEGKFDLRKSRYLFIFLTKALRFLLLISSGF